MTGITVKIVVPVATVDQARRRVSAAVGQLTRAENDLAGTRGCPMFVHPTFTAGCLRCVEYDMAQARVTRAERRVENARARLQCVESQQREPEFVGGVR